MSKASESAAAFVFGLLRRELEARGDFQDGPHLGELLRLTPTKEAPLASDAGEGPVKVTLVLSQHLTDASIELDAETGALTGWFVDFLAPEGTRALPAPEALALATRVASPPPEAALESAGYVVTGGRTVYRARWIHREQGLLVEGDFLEVLINGACGRAFSFTRRWRKPRLGESPAGEPVV